MLTTTPRAAHRRQTDARGRLAVRKKMISKVVNMNTVMTIEERGGGGGGDSTFF